ncbi:MAG: hypothetical protein COB98_10465 [Flavobacteriaceae bacterium]|nr:MAG: hypothetical protein COB98_10465 [Flavobacteriaceae bacterium]
MRKKLVYSIFILLTLLYSAYWIRYERASSSIKMIPKESSAAFQLNLRNVEKLFLFDVLKNPLLYTKKKDSLVINSERTSIFKLLNLPRNLIFYTTKSMEDSIFYSENLVLKKPVIFKKQLILNNYKNSKNTLGNTAIYSKNHHSFIIKEDTIKIAIHLSKTFPINKSETIQFNPSNTIPVTSKFNFDPQADFQCWNEKTGSYLGAFLNGKITFSSDSVPATLSQQTKQNNTIGYIHGNTRNIPFLSQQNTAINKAFKRLTNNSLDSINSYWDGALQLTLSSFKTITDSIISYDYDENFNQIRKVKLQQRIVPNLHLNFGQNSASKLWTYFKNNNTLKRVQKDSVFTLIPMLPLKATLLNNTYYFYTDSILKNPPPSLDEKGLHFFIDITQIKENTTLEVFNHKQLQAVQSIKGNINRKHELSIQINCNNPYRNGLIQLFKN